MALAAGEVLEGGGVHDAQGRPSYTSGSGAPPAGSFWSGGFLRDADGRKLIAIETLGAAPSAGSYFSGGRLRDAYGRMIVAQSSGALGTGQYISGGDVLDAQGRLVLAGESLGAAITAGDFSSSGLRDQYGRRVGAGLSAFSPASIAGIFAWWKADSLTGLADGDPVATVTDSSGLSHSLLQPTSTKRPLYKTAVQNGLPVLRFDGTDDFMTNGSLAATSTRTIFLVGVARAGGGVQRFFGVHSQASIYDAGGTATYYSNSASGGVSLAGNSRTWFIATVVYSAGSATVYYNGANAATFTPFATFSTATSIGIAAQDSVGTSPLTGDIGEVLIYDATLSASDRQAIVDYLKGKWGIA